MKEQELLKRLKSSSTIPSMPQVIHRFLDVVRDPVFSYDDLVDVLSTDPGLTGDVLKLANSAFFGVNRRVAGLHQALALLGMRRVRSLVLGRHMVRSMCCGESHNDLFDIFWHRSLATAVVSSRFAKRHAAALAEEAMVAGLLADAGVIVMAEGLQDYVPLLEHYPTDAPAAYAAREREALGLDHAELGAAILEDWQLPAFIIEAVRRRYAGWPARACNSEQRSLAQLLNGAGQVSWLVTGRRADEVIVGTCLEAAEQVGTDLSGLLEVLDETELDVQELGSLLQIQVLPLEGCELVCRKLSEHLCPSGRT
jgi:two-component system cell cycle response regulator